MQIQLIDPVEKTAPPGIRLEVHQLAAAFVRVDPLGQQARARRRVLAGPIRLVAGRAARVAHVKRLAAEQIALVQVRALEGEMVRVEDPVRRRRAHAGQRRSHAEQMGRALVAAAALDPARRERERPAGEVAVLDPVALVAVEVPGGATAVDQLDLAVEAVAAEVHQPPAALEDPRLDRVVHLPRPVLGVLVEDQDAVAVQVEDPAVELVLGVEVVRDALALQPAGEPPRRRRDVLGPDPPHRRRDLLVLVDAVDGLRPVEGQRVVVVVRRGSRSGRRCRAGTAIPRAR